MKNRSLLKTLILSGLAVILVIIEFYFQSSIDGITEKIPINRIIMIVNMVIFIIFLLLLISIRNLFFSAKQEKLLEIQEIYIGHLQELVRVIRSQRHDFVNHLQAVYALLKTDEINKAQKYIEDLYQDVKITGEILRVNIPELSALLLVKMGIAASRDISFEIEVESNLNLLKIKAVEINTIVGNLVDNAFDAVESLALKKRIVELKVFERPKRYVLQILNPGYISKEMMGKIFLLGFSTKVGGTNRGIGLASVKSLVEKNKGKIIVSSNRDQGIKFTVIFPKVN